MAAGSGSGFRDGEVGGEGGGVIGKGGVPIPSMLDWVGGEEVRDEATAAALGVGSSLCT